MRDGTVTRVSETTGDRRQGMRTSEIGRPALFPLIIPLNEGQCQVGEWSRGSDSNRRPSLSRSVTLFLI